MFCGLLVDKDADGSMVFWRIRLALYWTWVFLYFLIEARRATRTALIATILAVWTSRMVSADVGHARRIVANAFDPSLSCPLPSNPPMAVK
jgi:hypothetical protein